MRRKPIEDTHDFRPQLCRAFNRDGTPAPDLIPVVLQDFPGPAVLYVASMSRRALCLTLQTRRIHVYSRSAKKVRRKGATSGDELEMVAVYVNCNQDSLLIRVRRLGSDGGACHTRRPDGPHRPSCFYRILQCTVGRRIKRYLTFLEP